MTIKFIFFHILYIYLCISDSVRYHAAIKLVNISAILNENIYEYLQLKILKYVSIYNTPPII